MMQYASATAPRPHAQGATRSGYEGVFRHELHDLLPLVLSQKHSVCFFG